MNLISEKLQNDIDTYLIKHQVKKGSKILIGLSGGPDSVALLSLLESISAKWKFILISAHINHGIRSEEECKDDYELVKTFSKSLNIEFHSIEIPQREIKEYASRSKKSIEEAAREYRYNNLMKILKTLKCDYLAVGHNLNDQLETIIMRVFQGSGAAGLRGMPDQRNIILRPIMNCERMELIRYLTEIDLKYRMDISNLEEKYLRNKVRLRLIPIISDIFPGYKKALTSLAEKMDISQDFIDVETNKKLCWESCSIGFRIKAHIFLNAPDILKINSLYNIFSKIKSSKGKGEKIPYRFLKPVLSISETRNNQILLKGHDLILISYGKYLFVKRDVVFNREKSYLINVKAGKDYKFAGQHCSIQETDDCSLSNNDPWISKSKILLPIIIRSRKPGDKICLQYGKKKLKKLYNEWKVHSDDRWILPIVEDKEGILAVLGEHLGYKNMFSIRSRKKQERNTDRKFIFRIEKMETYDEY